MLVEVQHQSHRLASVCQPPNICFPKYLPLNHDRQPEEKHQSECQFSHAKLSVENATTMKGGQIRDECHDPARAMENTPTQRTRHERDL